MRADACRGERMQCFPGENKGEWLYVVGSISPKLPFSPAHAPWQVRDGSEPEGDPSQQNEPAGTKRLKVSKSQIVENAFVASVILGNAKMLFLDRGPLVTYQAGIAVNKAATKVASTEFQNPRVQAFAQKNAQRYSAFAERHGVWKEFQRESLPLPRGKHVNVPAPVIDIMRGVTPKSIPLDRPFWQKMFRTSNAVGLAAAALFLTSGGVGLHSGVKRDGPEGLINTEDGRHGVLTLASVGAAYGWALNAGLRHRDPGQGFIQAFTGSSWLANSKTRNMRYGLGLAIGSVLLGNRFGVFDSFNTLFRSDSEK